MPSPVGHSVIGLAVGLAYGVPRCRWRELGSQVTPHAGIILLAVVLANLPDLDFIPGLLIGSLNAYHHGYTHTLGAVLVVGGGWWVVWRMSNNLIGWRELVFVLAALSSHLVADLFCDDGLAPYGIMALWPFSDQYYRSPVWIFGQLRKDRVSDMFQGQNVWTVCREAAWTLPLVAAVLGWKCRTQTKTAHQEVRPP